MLQLLIAACTIVAAAAAACAACWGLGGLPEQAKLHQPLANSAPMSSILPVHTVAGTAADAATAGAGFQN